LGTNCRIEKDHDSSLLAEFFIILNAVFRQFDDFITELHPGANAPGN